MLGALREEAFDPLEFVFSYAIILELSLKARMWHFVEGLIKVE